MKKLFLIVATLAFIASCAGTEKKTKSSQFDPQAYFPIKDGCSWIYLVGKEGADKKHYIVKVITETENGGMVAWGEKTYTYIYRDDGVFNMDEDSYVLKNKSAEKWTIKNGTAEIIGINDLSGEIIAVKETYPSKGFYTLSYYRKKKGLIKFEVYSLQGENEQLIEKMELSERLCSDVD